MEAHPAWLPDLGDRPCRYYETLGSTNQEAGVWLAEGAPAGAIVVADVQTSGRGRQGRHWVAAPGAALLLSMVLRPTLSPDALPRVMIMGAVALAEALESWGFKPGIKWPNDVLLEGRKVAGILAEASWSGERLQGVVLGIGVNLRAHTLTPEDLATFRATTVETVLGHPPDRGELLAALLARLDHWRQRLLEPALLTAWQARNVTLGRPVKVTMGHTVYQGVAEAIDDEGALLLRLASGELQRVLAGDVTLRDI